jgi:ipoprotein LpqH
VNGRWLVVASAVVIASAAGCSTQPAHRPAPGTLPAGTAELSVNGSTAQVTDAVQCESIEWMRTIRTGNQSSGVTVMLSNANKLFAEFVRFHDFDGFTGSYDRHLQGEAAVAMTGPTYRIAGTAVGYADAAPTRRTTEPFELRVSC